MTSERNPGGWPDAARPGYPEKPLESRAHVLRRADGYEFPAWWLQIEEVWMLRGGATLRPGAIQNTHYIGPCLTPAEGATRVAAARREGIEAAMGAVKKIKPPPHIGLSDGPGFCDGCDEAEAAIRALLEDGR